MPGLPRNMTVYRLPDGGLLLYSVIAMHEEGLRALEALGTPAVMVMPHDRHQMDAPFYKRRYPKLRVLAPEPSSPRNVPVDGRLDELAAFGIHAYALPDTTYHAGDPRAPSAGERVAGPQKGARVARGVTGSRSAPARFWGT